MPTQDKTTLKNYFNTGDRPTEQEFANLIDSTVLKVNGMLPNANGEVTVTNISGTASTITGTITKSQVTGLQGDLDSKVNTVNVKTINNQNIVNGAGNITINSAPVTIIAIPNQDYVIGSQAPGNNNAFPSNCDRFSLQPNKTYFFRGKYIIHTVGLSGQPIANQVITFLFAPATIVVTSLEYVVRTSGASGNGLSTNMSMIQISGIDPRAINTSNSLPKTTVEFEGVLRCTTGAGSLTPKLTFSTAANENKIKVGSFIEFIEVGDDQVFRVGPPNSIS